MRKKQESEARDLDLQIQLTELKDFMDKFDSAQKKDMKRRLRNIAICFAPTLLLAIPAIIFANPSFFAIGAGITGIGFSAVIIKDSIKESNKPQKIIKQRENPNLHLLDDDPDEILHRGIGNSRGKDFYTTEMKAYINGELKRDETEGQRRYREAVARQNQTPNLEIVSSPKKGLNKEETMAQLVSDIYNTYCVIYNIPPLEISNQQWDTYFDILYDYFTQKGIENQFYETMSSVLSFILSSSLVHHDREITIQTFIDGLENLIYSKIDKNDILMLQNKIRESLSRATIINLSDYRGHRNSR